MSKLVTTVVQAPSYISKLRKQGHKLLKKGLRGQARYQKLRGIVWPYEDKNYSWLHKSILYEEHRRHDPTPLILEAIGEFEESDAIHPMLIQQGLTLLATAEIAENGILVNVPSYSKVMLDFVQPLEDVVDMKSPKNWKVAIQRPRISFAQPYLNTVGLGMTQHIWADFNAAFGKQDDSLGIISPEDWINAWAIVQGVTGETVPFFQDVSGRNSWSSTGWLLEGKYTGALVKSVRDIPYIRYARGRSVNLDGLIVGCTGVPDILMKDPDAEMKQSIKEIIKKMRLQAQLRQLASEIKLQDLKL